MVIFKKGEETLICEMMCSERRRVEQKIAEIQKRLDMLPKGKLICTKNGKYVKWFQSDGHQIQYIPKKNRELAEKLAARKYLQEQLEACLREEKAIAAYLQHNEKHMSRAEQLFSEHSLYSELLFPYFTPDSKELKAWMEQNYDENPKYPEQRIHKTSAGILVRSKSEALITMLLHINKIPFRYECPLILGDITLHPDFTIRHPKTGKVYYYEHFGQMDHPEYCKNALAKLQIYVSHGIYPTFELLTSFETKEHPLDLSRVEEMLKSYFL